MGVKLKPFSKFGIMRLHSFSVNNLILPQDIPDPRGLERESNGFVRINESIKFITSVNSIEYHFKVKKKVLPPNVLLKEYNIVKGNLERTAGGLLTKTQLAEIKEEVEREMLKKAFVDETVIRVIVIQNMGFVGNTLVFVETTSTAILDSVSTEFRKLGISVELNLGFGKTFLMQTAFGTISQNIQQTGDCVFKGTISSDKRQLTLKNFELTPELVRYYLSDSLLLDKAQYALSDTLDSLLLVFTINSKDIFSKINYPFKIEYENNRDLYHVEQTNLLIFEDLIRKLLSELQYDLFYAEKTSEIKVHTPSF